MNRMGTDALECAEKPRGEIEFFCLRLCLMGLCWPWGREVTCGLCYRCIIVVILACGVEAKS